MSPIGIEGNFMSVANRSPVQTDSTQSNSPQITRNRRRTSPEASVSLRHGIYSSSAAEPNKPFAVPPTLRHGDPTSHRYGASQYKKSTAAGQLPPLHEQQQQQAVGRERQQQTQDIDQESAFRSNGSNERSVPEDWFKNWNTNVGDFNGPNITDGRSTRQQQQFVSFFNPSYPSMLPTQDSEDESDVYRSVIDDLTVKNKKLKKKLRKMERLHCNELNEEKLFEIRCYGLPPSRKQELQELLQKFAAGLEEGTGGVYETKRSDAVSNANATSSTNPSSSSLLQNTDSAYATETRMTSLDGGSTDPPKAKLPAPGQTPGKPRTISTTTLNPEMRPIQFANEMVRMKMVVKRLEQLFTGSDALQLNGLEKVKQQQQVAVDAAAEKHGSTVDETAESGDEDDKREAALMSQQQDDDLSQVQSHDQRSSADASHQRPTRPMDLDPNRAQVAAENVEYLEQMSHSSSHKYHKPTAAGEITGWVYLNLINNMAQIHTLNVSLAFIKKSIRTLSDKLELSPDGNKVRWKGGFIGTRMSSDGETSSAMESSSTGGESSPGESSGGAKVKINPTPKVGKPSVKTSSVKGLKPRTSGGSSPDATASVYNTIDNFRYRPLVFHSLGTQKSSSSDSSDQDCSDSASEAATNNSGGPPPIVDNGSNIGLGDINKFAPLDGPVIYFGGSGFCTDLSAQVVFREGGHVIPRNGETSNYKRLVDTPIGLASVSAQNNDEKMDPLPLSNFDWSSQDMEMALDGGSEESLPELTSIMTTTSEILPSAMPPPYDFSVSGLGGIRPEDNFVTYVKTVQKPVRSAKFRVKKPERISHSIPIEALNAFRDSADDSTEIGFQNDILDTLHIRLPPSKLPEPTLMFTLSDESSDPFLSTPDERRSDESHLSFAYNIESDSRSSGEGVPSFHSPDLADRSPMDLDAEEGIIIGENPLAPLSVVATAGTSENGSVASPKEMPILKSLDDMDIGGELTV
ncbi:hypothetical protein AA313_de0202254 [Arthrobotrys entomopaga]|nr:hypothetical protein AA313_de0202254 [Arthrobotrys entomopaga]